ncbi:MAG: NAD(P)-binding domain-containing protein [Chlamydiales bacterium]
MQIKAAGIGAFGNMHRFFGKFLPKDGPIQYLHLFDTEKQTPETLAARTYWEKHGAKFIPKGDYKALTSKVNLVTICVGKHQEALEIYPALIEAWKPPSGFLPTVIDFSTYSVKGAVAIHSFCQNHQVRWVNVPLTGGPVGAEEGTMVMMYGGPKQLYQTLLPILFEKVGTPFFAGEEVSSGTQVKIMNQCIVFGQLEGFARALAMDAFAFRENSFGDSQQIELFERLNQGAGGGNQWSRVFYRALKRDHWTKTGFMNAHAAVDAIYAADFAIDCKLSRFAVVCPLLTTASTLGFAMKQFGMDSITPTLAKALLSKYQNELDVYLDAIGYFAEPNMKRALDLVIESLPEPVARSVVIRLSFYIAE